VREAEARAVERPEQETIRKYFREPDPRKEGIALSLRLLDSWYWCMISVAKHLLVNDMLNTGTRTGPLYGCLIRQTLVCASHVRHSKRLGEDTVLRLCGDREVSEHTPSSSLAQTNDVATRQSTSFL
jgi:hypothetical protein